MKERFSFKIQTFVSRTFGNLKDWSEIFDVISEVKNFQSF